MKSQLGVTMIELVIVLIITMVIATVAISSGKKTLTEADVTEVYVEMSTIQKTINTVMMQMEMNTNLRLEQGKHYDIDFDTGRDTSVQYGDNVLGAAEEWCIIYGVTADREEEKAIYDISKVRETLGLDSINHSYIVNYNTGEVELLRPLVIDSKQVRTYEQVRTVAE